MSSRKRAKVVDNVDPQKLGRVKVFIPDDMDKTGESTWASPGNSGFSNPNGTEFSGTFMVPTKGSYVWVEKMDNSTQSWVYVGGTTYKDKSSLPYECKTGGNPEMVYTVFKSASGAGLIVSDDPANKCTVIKGPRCDGSNAGKIVHDTDMSINLDETNQKLVIKSGTSATAGIITMNKSDGSITLQCNPSNYIQITPAGITLKGVRIDLNP